MTEMNGGP